MGQHDGMKVLDLQCPQGHGFEGWFASEDDYSAQTQRGLLACPLCGETGITRLPSAPRLNLSGAKAPQPPAGRTQGNATEVSAPATAAAKPAPELQALWLKAVQHVMAHTEDVGPQFAEEARRMHYGEAEERGIRGQTTADERAALADEGIEVLSLPLPQALKGPLQ